MVSGTRLRLVRCSTPCRKYGKHLCVSADGVLTGTDRCPSRPLSPLLSPLENYCVKPRGGFWQREST
jgi:hypothetical protein